MSVSVPAAFNTIVLQYSLKSGVVIPPKVTLLFRMSWVLLTVFFQEPLAIWIALALDVPGAVGIEVIVHVPCVKVL